MTIEHQSTREEEAYGRLLKETEQILSEAAWTLLGEAETAAYRQHLVRSYSYTPQDYVEAMKKMHLAAAELTGRDREHLSELWRAALAAAASLDPDDFETLAGYRVYSGDLHRYYRMVSGMIEDILHKVAAEKVRDLEEKLAEWKAETRQAEPSEREPEDLSDIPF